MNVMELRIALMQMPPDATVRTEGCDCYGDVTNVYVLTKATDRENVRAGTPEVGEVIIGREEQQL